MTVITMGGLEWGGARSLGPLVAEKLEADYVDKLILTDVAKHVGATVNSLHERESRPPRRRDRFSRLLLRIMERMAEGSMGADPYTGFGWSTEFFTNEYEDLPQPIITGGHQIEDEPYIEALTKVMKEVAAAGNVVIVGRAGHILLKDEPRVLKVGVVAEFDDRIATIMKRENLDRERAERTLLARGKARGHLFKRFFNIDNPDDPKLYNLVINTSLVNLEHAVDIVIGALTALTEGQFQRQDEVRMPA